MRGTQTTDHYQLLGLSHDATAAEVKVRYRALSKQHHPDKGGDQAEMAKINQAYAILADTFKRKIYDAERRRRIEQAQPARQPAPRPNTRFSAGVPSVSKNRPRWWPKIAFGFASAVIVAGILLHLPIAEAVSTTTDTETPAQTLNVTYPPDTVPSHLVTNPVNTASSQASETNQQTTPEVPPAPTDQEDTVSPSKQKLREMCSLAARNHLYNTEQVQTLCKSTRAQD